MAWTYKARTTWNNPDQHCGIRSLVRGKCTNLRTTSTNNHGVFSPPPVHLDTPQQTCRSSPYLGLYRYQYVNKTLLLFSPASPPILGALLLTHGRILLSFIKMIKIYAIKSTKFLFLTYIFCNVDNMINIVN